ncbi:hypothetical protein LNQ03_28015 [Klebsiella pneumoniae subsp. pneumoniae]|nr:hypothetical protein [Klebsiella pneumoniae subsp. pneumoniae]
MRLVRWSVRYHATHADYMRVICMENMQRGKWLKSSGELKPLNRTALSILGRHFTARPAAGRLSGGLDARDVHRLISSFSFYQVSNSTPSAACILTIRYPPSTMKRWWLTIVTLPSGR